MYIKSLDRRYNLVEFNFYGAGANTVHVLDLLLDCSIEEFEKNSLDNVVVIEDGDQFHIFVGYEVNEYYEENGYLKVICIK